MSKNGPHFHQDCPATYQIQLQGRISPRWAKWFTGMTIAVTEMADGQTMTTMTGAVIDQAALLGMLQQLYNLGFFLLKVECQTEISR